MSKLQPIKSLGQNFLQDKNIQLKIVEALGIQPKDKVIEIGPGEGAITDHLVRMDIELTVIDIDKRSVELLEKKYKSFENINIINHDILKYDGLTANCKVIGNLPYYISSQIMFYLYDNIENISVAVIMIQKEVAERLLAKPNNKDYGKLTVLLQTFFDIEKVVDVSPHCFYPKPKVWSSVIKLTPKANQPNLNKKLYWEIIKNAFSQRRKQLGNTLKQYPLIIESDIFPQYKTKRPENLTVKDFITLHNIINDDGV
jgi:16S rRNA (adenine1518-N6/adenine1519-N6)-dimethyltransferase